MRRERLRPTRPIQCQTWLRKLSTCATNNSNERTFWRLSYCMYHILAARTYTYHDIDMVRAARLSFESLGPADMTITYVHKNIILRAETCCNGKRPASDVSSWTRVQARGKRAYQRYTRLNQADVATWFADFWSHLDCWCTPLIWSRWRGLEDNPNNTH
jgi:hypothetical protein